MERSDILDNVSGYAMFAIAIAEANMGETTSGSVAAYPVLYDVLPIFL